MTERKKLDDYAKRLEALGVVRCRAMFGEWGVYINESFAAIIGDNRLFIKVKGVPEETVLALFGNRNQPYDGASNYAEADPADFEDPKWVAALRMTLIAAKVLPTTAPPRSSD